MGYRSTFTTNDIPLKLPSWFVERWGDKVHTGAGNSLPVSSRYEAKTYGIWAGFEDDLSRVLREAPDEWGCIQIVFMGEDGVCSPSTIYPDRVEGAHATS